MSIITRILLMALVCFVGGVCGCCFVLEEEWARSDVLDFGILILLLFWFVMERLNMYGKQ
jgi:hypothetical protein